MEKANNSFGKGLNFDISNYQFPNDLMTYCRNCDYLTSRGNEGLLQNTKGNSLIEGIKENYFPIAVKVYGGIAYIISAEVQNNTFTGRGEIGSFPSPDYENLSLKNGRTLIGEIDYKNPKYRPFKNYLKEDEDPLDENVLNENLAIYGTNTSVYSDFNSELFNFSEFYDVDIEVQPSYDNTINVIFTDHHNPIRVINSRFTALPNNVVEIRDRIGQNDSNLYNKGNFENTINLSQNSTKIVNVDLDTIAFGGELLSGVYNYYFKYATQDGNTTNIIAETFSIPVFHGTTLSDARGGDSNFLQNTRKLIRIKLSNLDTSYRLIKVQYSYSSGDQVLNTEYYELENSYNITGDTLIFEHTGRESQFPVSRVELGIDYSVAFTAKTLTQANNRLYAGNIKSKEYNLVEFEEYAYKIKIGHKQKKIEVPYTSAAVDDNSIYNSELTTKIENTTDSKSIGYRNGYYNPYNVYYYLPYYPGEKYMYSCRYVLDDGSMSQSYPLRGIDNWDNDKYGDYFNEDLNESNNFFSDVNGENLRGLYRFPIRNSFPGFATQNDNDISYTIIDEGSNINKQVKEIGSGNTQKTLDAFDTTGSIANTDISTIETFYFNQVQTTIGNPAFVSTEDLEELEDPNNVNYFFSSYSFTIADCDSNPNCNTSQDIIDCNNNPNCVVQRLRPDCELITQEIEVAPGLIGSEIVSVQCNGDQYDNVTVVADLQYSNVLDNEGNPFGTTYDYTVLSTRNAQSNIFAVTFELPSETPPEGTIGIQFMRSTENTKDTLTQGYLIDTLPVPSIDIFGKEESGNRYVDHFQNFRTGGKLVPSVDFNLESPSVWDRRGLGSSRKKIREDEVDNFGLQPILFNDKGWQLIQPYEVRKHFAFISNDIIVNPSNVSSILTGGNFKLQELSKIGLYTSVRTNSRDSENDFSQYFSLYKTVLTENTQQRLIDCNLDWVTGNVDSKTPNGFSSRCLFTGTHNGNKFNSFVAFPLKFNTYVGVTTEEDITLGEFSQFADDDRLGQNLNLEPNYGGPDNPSLNVIRPAAILVSIYRDLGFDLGTNTDDLNRIQQSRKLDSTTYTPVTKRLYWEKPIDEINSISIDDVTEDGKIVAYNGDNFVSLGIRQIYNNIYGLNDESPEGAFKRGRVGYSLSLVNDSIYNPLFRTIEIPNQAEDPLNYYPNILSSSPNNFGSAYGQGNQWRDYEELESSAFNNGALKTFTDRNYITIVGRVPFLNTDFSTRVIYSELHVQSAIENGYRNFLPSAYKDYSQEVGDITALRTVPSNNSFLVMVQDTGISLVPVRQRDFLADANASTAGTLYFEESGIIGGIDKIQQLTKNYGSKWLSSIVVTNTGVYGVDIDNAKIWRVGSGLEFISDYKIQSWLRLLRDSYLYKSVNLLQNNIYAYHDMDKNYVHFTFKDVECTKEELSTVPYAWEVDYQNLIEFENGRPTGNTKPNIDSDPDYIIPEIFDGEESPCPFKEPEPFPLDVNIYVVWDGFSFSPSVKSQLQQNIIGPWIQNFRNTYPQWAGNLQQLTAAPTPEGEQWLRWVNYATGSSKAVVICMVDEANRKYHNPTLASGDLVGLTSALSQPGTTQPTSDFISDRNNFLNLYNNTFEYFKGMVYCVPAGLGNNPLYTNFQLHTYCAIEGTTVSTTNFLPSFQGDISIIQTENLYSTLGPGLKNYGWQEKHQFNGQASDLTLAQFTADINPLILDGNEPTDNFTGWKPDKSDPICTPLYKTVCLELTPKITQNISYSESTSYWNSLWGYFPSKTFNIFNEHYSFDGSLSSPTNNIWKHNINNIRCNFYGTQDEFVFEFVVADNIQFQKIYNNFIVLCNEVPPIHIEYITDNEPTIDDVEPNPIKEPRVQNVYNRYRGRIYTPYDTSKSGQIENKIIKYNSEYKENHMYIQIDDRNLDTLGKVVPSPYKKKTNARIRDKYVKVRFKYKGDEYSIIQAVITAYEISFS